MGTYCVGGSPQTAQGEEVPWPGPNERGHLTQRVGLTFRTVNGKHTCKNSASFKHKTVQIREKIPYSGSFSRRLYFASTANPRKLMWRSARFSI